MNNSSDTNIVEVDINTFFRQANTTVVL